MYVTDCVALRINESTKNFFLLEITIIGINFVTSSFLCGIFVESNFFILVLNSLNTKSNGYLTDLDVLTWVYYLN